MLVGPQCSTTCHAGLAGLLAVTTDTGTHQGGRSPVPLPQRCAPATVKGACTWGRQLSPHAG